jgi:dTDP-4-amino-4,6-dideoxygalactose transaminase
MIKLTIPNLPDRKLFFRHVDEIFSSQVLTNNGPKVAMLEKKLCEFTGCKHTILMSNGTVTLYALLKSLPKKGKIITTPFSYIATVSAIVEAGHTPVFCDTALHSTNIAPADVLNLIDDDVAAILPVHCYGNHCDVDGFDELSKNCGVPVFYDAAHAFCGRIGEKSILTYGKASSVSFHATKVFNCVEGGAVFTNCDELASKVKAARTFGFSQKNEFIANSLNFKLSEIHAAMGLALFPSINCDQKKRLEIFSHYFKSFPSHTKCILENPNTTHTLPYMPVVSSKYTPDEMISLLNSKGILSRRYFYPPLFEYYKEYSGNAADFPNSLKLANSVVCLPLHHELSVSDIQRICEAIA